ncbi:Pumilio homology domain family member 6, partial [Smittium culicis]
SAEKNREQKLLKEQRKSAKPEYQLISDLKKRWEIFRRKDNPLNKRHKAVAESLEMIKGKIKEVTFKHDCSRIIQSILKIGDLQQRNLVAEELKTSYLDLSMGKYGKYIVIRILRYCPTYRDQVISSFYGNVRKMIKYKESAVVLEECYSTWANATQQSKLIQEFYGPEFSIFKDGPLNKLSSIKKNSNSRLSASDIITAFPEKKVYILKNLKQTIESLLIKETIQKSIVHRCILEYMLNAELSDAQEMAAILKEVIVEILHTKDGSKAGALCLFYAANKDRKFIVKSFKQYLEKIVCEEFGHWNMLAALDSLDDTVFMHKSIISDLVKLIDQVSSDRLGRRVLFYILCGRNAKYIGSDALAFLKSGDEIRAKTCKKDDSVRRKELIGYLSPSLLKWAEKTATKSIKIPLDAQLLVETLVNCAGDKTLVMNNLCSLLEYTNDEKVIINNEMESLPEDHILNNFAACRAFSLLAKADKDSDEDSTKFGPIILESIKSVDGLMRLLVIKGEFLLVSLLESPLTAEDTKKELSAYLELVKRKQKESKANQDGKKGDKSAKNAKGDKKESCSVYDIILRLLN